MSLKYESSNVTAFPKLSKPRCPICSFPMYNGTQLYCEPGVCLYRDTPVTYKIADKAAKRWQPGKRDAA